MCVGGYVSDGISTGSDAKELDETKQRKALWRHPNGGIATAGRECL